MRRRHPWRLTLVLVLALAGGCGGAHANKRSDTFGFNRSVAERWVAAGDYERALPSLSRLLLEDSDDVGLLVLRGRTYRGLGMLPEAEADLRRALTLQENAVAAHAGLAVVLDLTRRPAEAEQHHRRAVELEPKSAAYLNNLGFSLFAGGRATEAIAAYKAALRLDPVSAVARNNLGFALAQLGRMTEAAREFELAGSPAQAKNNLGFAYERRGNLVQAHHTYEEAVRLDPGLVQAQRNLAHVSAALAEPAAPSAAAAPKAGAEESR